MIYMMFIVCDFHFDAYILEILDGDFSVQDYMIYARLLFDLCEDPVGFLYK